MDIDINADVGESFGIYTIGCDATLLASITSASVAAGFHAGDPTVLRQTIRLARSAGVAVGAHPGFPDLVGFGRRALQATPAEVEDMVLYQVAAVAGVAAAEGVTLQHVKPHGALFNLAALDPQLADAVARAVAAFDPALTLVGLAGSALIAAGRAAGLCVAAEAYADRGYRADGTLLPRQAPGALLDDPATVVARAVRMVDSGRVLAADGAAVELGGLDTLCVHGDTPGADRVAAALRAALEDAGIGVRSMGRRPIRQPGQS